MSKNPKKSILVGKRGKLSGRLLNTSSDNSSQQASTSKSSDPTVEPKTDDDKRTELAKKKLIEEADRVKRLSAEIGISASNVTKDLKRLHHSPQRDHPKMSSTKSNKK